MPTFDQSSDIAAALRHHANGRFREAEEIYREALGHDRTNPDLLHLSGVLCGQTRRMELAVDLIDRAIAIRPDVARYHSDLGNVHCDAGRLQDAILCYERAIELAPMVASYHNNLGTALRDLGDYAGAELAYHRAIRLDPQSPQVHNNFGVVLNDQGKLEQAITFYRRAIQLKPDYADAHTNLGVALYANRQGDEAVASCRKAVEISPSFAKAHSNLALILLGTGNYREGWKEHEWRWRCNPAFKPRAFAQRQWDGSSLTGRTILLHTEQGFGDAIQFCRYVPLVAQHAQRVILECQPELARLFETLHGSTSITMAGQRLPVFDTHCPLMSLPLMVGGDSIPAGIPYLHPRRHLVEAWQEKLGPRNQARIGIAWLGRPTHSNDRNRSMPSENLSVLASLHSVEWHSLQNRAPADPPSELSIIDHSSELNDFADTSALIANLDLVISVDTAVAHLAGALGKPVWLLLPFAAEWRWMLDRGDSPWYPTMRLFRQERWGDWPGVMRRIREALQSEW